jgi:hypothetical protein
VCTSRFSNIAQIGIERPLQTHEIYFLTNTIVRLDLLTGGCSHSTRTQLYPGELYQDFYTKVRKPFRCTLSKLSRRKTRDCEFCAGLQCNIIQCACTTVHAQKMNEAKTTTVLTQKMNGGVRDPKLKPEKGLPCEFHNNHQSENFPPIVSVIPEQWNIVLYCYVISYFSADNCSEIRCEECDWEKGERLCTTPWCDRTNFVC